MSGTPGVFLPDTILSNSGIVPKRNVQGKLDIYTIYWYYFKSNSLIKRKTWILLEIILRNVQEDCFGRLKAEPFLASLFLLPFASYLKGFSQCRGMTLSVFWKVLQGQGLGGLWQGSQTDIKFLSKFNFPKWQK